METNDELLKDMNRIANEMIRSHLPKVRPVSIRYFSNEKKDKYFWTTGRVRCTYGNDKFVSGVYRYLKTKKQWIARKKAFHARRKDAKRRAGKLYREGA